MKQLQNKLIGLLCCCILLGCGGQEQQAPPTESTLPAQDSIPGVDMSRPLVTPEEKAQMAGMVLVPYVEQNRWGFADTTGKVVIAPKYWWVEQFEKNDLAVVRDISGYGLINKLGREVVAPVHDEKLKLLGCGIWAFVEEDGYAVLTNELKRIDGNRVKGVSKGSCSDGIFLVQLRDDKLGFMDIEGKLLPIPAAKEGYRFHHGVAPIQLEENEHWVVVDRKGKRVGKDIDSLKLDWLYPFTDGLGVGRVGMSFEDMRWGVLDTLGNVVLPFEYGHICGDFVNGYVAAQTYNPYGNKLPPPGKRISHIYDRHGRQVGQTTYEVWDNFSEGLVVIKRNEKFGFMDTTGRVVIAPKYDWACAFKMGLAWVRRGELYGFIDHSGKEVIPLRYDGIYDYYFMMEEGVDVKDPLTGEVFYIDKHGREYRSTGS